MEDAKETSAGLDQWTLADLRMLSPKAYESVAKMLNEIEGGKEWPRQMHTARAAFLPKDETNSQDPLEYRVLLMLPAVHRKWAKTRLRHLASWVQEWQLDEMFAEVEGKGAADAAYIMTLRIELCKFLGEDFAGAAVADIYKCFDQIQRPLLYETLRKAGMPGEILGAYKKFQEAMKVRNTIAGGLGEEHVRKTSIPQGGPFSMMNVALLMRPWMMQMKACAATPRILADDLQILTTGPRHHENLTYAFDLTHKHMEDMGARIAPTKSVTFASNSTSRKWLREHRWRKLGKRYVCRRICETWEHISTPQQIGPMGQR